MKLTPLERTLHLKGCSIRRLLPVFLMVFLCFTGNTAFAQNMRVTGKVVNADTGEAIPGASVVVEGTLNGIATDVDGNYTLQVPVNGTLVFSFIGYAEVKVKVSGQSTINVQLKQSALEMEELVVIGYGAVRKSDVTSSISTVDSKDIVKTPAASITQALQGNASGVLIMNTAADPGSDAKIRIRGGSSISGSNEPLIVIDGFPSDASILSMLNPNDVKSMEILKDAAATAIFGSRGANGVILISTKSGTEGKAKINVDAKVGLATPRRMLEMMDAPEWQRYADDALTMTSNPDKKNSYDFAPELLETTNFQDLLIRNVAQRHDYNISVSGGGKESTYYVSAGYLKEDGLLNNSSSDRMSTKTKLTMKLHEKVKLQMNLSTSRRQTQSIAGGDTGAMLRTLMIRPKKPTGNFEDGVYRDPDTGEILSIQAETARAMNSNLWKKSFNADVSGALTWNMIKGMNLNVSGSYSYTDKLGYRYVPRSIYLKYSDIQKNNKAERSSDQTIKWVNENTLNYVRSFGRHNFNLVAGQSWERRMDEGFNASVTEFGTDHYMWNNLGAGLQTPVIGSGKSEYGLVSFFSRVIYNYDKRYLATLTWRSDGSSRFGEDRKFGNFPSASFAWNIHNENFMKGNHTFSNLRFRLSWGITGNDGIGNYRSMSLVNSTKVLIDGTMQDGYKINRIGNSELQWETTEQYNTGIDAGLWKGRITLGLDAYYKKTYNLLYSMTIPATTGYSIVMTNLGNVDNQGVEIELNTRNIERPNFTWTTNFNIGLNRSKVTDMGGNDNISLGYIGNYIKNDLTFLMLGEPHGVIRGYRTKLFNDWKEVYADGAVWVEQSNSKITTKPGMLMYKDVDGDGEITDADKEILGHVEPNVMGGFTNTFRYKNLDLTVFFNYAMGNKVVNTNLLKLRDFRGGNNGQYKMSMESYRLWNPQTGNQGYTASDALPVVSHVDYLNYVTDLWVEDGSYLRLKTLTLGYHFPEQLIRHWRVGSIYTSLTAVNLLTFTKYSGMDPEMSSPLSTMGVDQSSYPASKTFLLNLNFTF